MEHLPIAILELVEMEIAEAAVIPEMMIPEKKWIWMPSIIGKKPDLSSCHFLICTPLQYCNVHTMYI